MSNLLENEEQFENRVVSLLSNGSRIIIRKNTQNYHGFIGRRKPDLVTIEGNVSIVVWELKSPRECKGNHLERHMWLRHPTPNSDYLSDKRSRHASDKSICAKVRGWCVVMDAELRYWLSEHNKPEAWRLPFNYSDALTNAAIAAPLSEKCALKQALIHLRLLTSWDLSTESGIVIAKGVL